MTSKMHVSRQDFEAWVDAIEGQTDEPSYRDSKLEVRVQVTETVHMYVNVTAISNEGGVRRYGRHETWNEVRFSTWIWDNVSMYGKGSRSNGTAIQVRKLFSLIGEFEG